MLRNGLRRYIRVHPRCIFCTCLSSDNVRGHQRGSEWSGLDACQVMSGASPVAIQTDLDWLPAKIFFRRVPSFLRLQKSPRFEGPPFEGPFQGHPFEGPFESHLPSKVPLNFKFQLKVSSKVCRFGGVR